MGSSSLAQTSREPACLAERCCDVDVHTDVHASVHTPGQGTAAELIMVAPSPYARAVQVGAAEASDVSGDGP
jgi:hypothetical protein